MNIGIIVHSITGNTLKVSKRLEERLLGNGHEVLLLKLRQRVKLKSG